MQRFIPFLLLFAVSHLQAAEVMKTAVFQRIDEPKEHSFTLLIPKGWQSEGGNFRIDPTAQGESSQSYAAKLDFTVKKDRAGSVMIRWLPDMLYFDASRSPAGQLWSSFPPGSKYQGMTISPVMSARQFLRQVVFTYAHPDASDIKILEEKSLPKLAQKFHQHTSVKIPSSDFSYDAALLSVTYRENGTRYEEKLITVIEDFGQLGAGIWGNKETFLVRTPLGKFAQWEAIVSVIRNSVKINSKWIANEFRGHVLPTTYVTAPRRVQDIEREIVEYQQKINAEINNDMFLTLMEQEEYVNPYTKEVETGSNQWKHRWINKNEEVIYTDNESYDPNTDVNLNLSGFKRTPIRKRFPEK